MSYQAVRIQIQKEEDADLLTGLLSRFDFNGIEEQEHTLVVYFSPDKMPQPTALKEAISRFPYEIEEIEDRNWNQEWEQHFKPVIFGHFCGIRAHFHEPVKEVRHEIIITPQMSFGTGHHETTALMIKLMEITDFKEKEVLDFGTGTGVLAILSRKMGANRVTGIDNDPNAVRNAKENVRQNQATRIDILQRNTPITGQTYDILLVNIVKNIILSHVSELMTVCRPHSQILLSGFFQTDQQDILKAFEPGNFKKTEVLQQGNWTGLKLVR